MATKQDSLERPRCFGLGVISIRNNGCLSIAPRLLTCNCLRASAYCAGGRELASQPWCNMIDTDKLVPLARFGNRQATRVRSNFEGEIVQVVLDG
jgi:hypothetical protein